MLFLSSFDKSAVPHRPHDKVFQAIFTQINDEDVTAFPAPADLIISNEHSLLLFASAPAQPLLHLHLKAILRQTAEVNTKLLSSIFPVTSYSSIVL